MKNPTSVEEILKEVKEAFQTELRLAELIAGLVRRQFACICREPYANAFNETANGACWEKDYPDQDPMVWEKKFEIDSLCYPVQLAYLLWKNTGVVTQFDENFQKGAKKILEVFETEQYHEEKSSYRFTRPHSFFTDTLSRGGRGALTKPGTGLIWSGLVFAPVTMPVYMVI